MGDNYKIIAEAEQVRDFLQRTPELSASEQAEIFGAVLENTKRSSHSRGGRGRSGHNRRSNGRRRPSRSSGGGVNFGQISQGIQTGLSLFQTGAQIVGGLANTFGGNDRVARDFSMWANRLGQGAGQIGGMFQMFQGGRVPRLPQAQGRIQQRPPQQLRTPQRPATITSRGPTAGGPMNATALMSMLMNNPQLMQTLRSAAFSRREEEREVVANIPESGNVAIPLGAVMNLLSHLARESVLELNQLTSEDDTETPEYLLGEDGELLVDPANSEDRAALVLHLLRLDGEVARFNESDGIVDNFDEEEGDSNEQSSVVNNADPWAMEAGFYD